MQRQEPRFEHLLWAVGGALVGAWWVKNQDDQAKKSRAERDDPEGVSEVCEDIAGVLDEWEPNDECKSEDEFVHDLAEWLSENVDWEIEVQPGTREGQPDILVGDLLALELKMNPTKSERDRCVGQSAGYSREWVTWVVLVDAPASAAGGLERLLADKGLGHILVWDFA